MAKETPAQQRDRLYNEARAAKAARSYDIPNQVGANIPNQVGKHIPNQVPVEGMGGYGGKGDTARKRYIDKITE